MLARCLASLLTFFCLAPALAVAPESMHLNSVGTFSVIRLRVAAYLTGAFRLVAETEEAEVIQAASSKSLCQRYCPVTRTLHQRRTVGFSHCLQDRFITFLGDQQGCLTILNLICITFSTIA